MSFLGGGGGNPSTIVQQVPVESAANAQQQAADKKSKQTKKQLKMDYGASLLQTVPKYAQSVASGADTTLSSGSLLGLS